MQSRRKALLIFMRYPQPGRVKSRLAAAIGAQPAAAVYEKLVRRTLGVVSDLKRRDPEIRPLIFFTPAERHPQMEQRFAGPWEFVPQHGTHLGHRMARAFAFAWDRGYGKAVIIGSDIADIEAADLQEAFAALDTAGAVLNPASDGGFYLLGLKRPCPAVFHPQQWGSGEIFARTKNLLRAAGLTVRCLRERHDIDRPADLQRFAEQPVFRDRLSIIIPTLSSIAAINSLLERLTAGLWPGDEIIIAGPSVIPARVGIQEICRYAQQSFEQATCPPAPLQISECCVGVSSAAGRGLQLNAGAHHARGDLLWFVHDDSSVPDQFGYLVRRLCTAQEMSLGCFRLAFSVSTPLLDLVARWGNWRTRFLKLPYGDQGLFCRRETFHRVGGFHRPQLMEDVDFVKRCRAHGGLLILPETLATSPRRYLQCGILRASLRNHLTMFLYHLGWSDERLRGFYYK